MQRPHKNTALPHGVAALETAFILPVLMLVLFAMLDLGLAALRYNALGAVADRVVRNASLHGNRVQDHSFALGPAPFTGTLATEDPLVAGLSALAVTMDPNEVGVTVQWLDSDNRPRDRVRVMLVYEHRPLLAISAWGAIQLRAGSTQPIIN